MPAYTWKKKQSAEYEHYQTFKMERFAKGKGCGVGRGGYGVEGGGVVELGPFDKGTS